MRHIHVAEDGMVLIFWPDFMPSSALFYVFCCGFLGRLLGFAKNSPNMGGLTGALLND